MIEQRHTQFITTVPGEYTPAESARMHEAFSGVGRLISPEAITEIRQDTTPQEDSPHSVRWQLLGQNIAELLLERSDLVDTRISRKLGNGLAEVHVTTVGQVLALSSEQTLMIPCLGNQAAKSRQALPRVMAALRKESQGTVPPMLVTPEPSDIAKVCKTISDVPVLALLESPSSADSDLIQNFTNVGEVATLSIEDIFQRINASPNHTDYYFTRARSFKHTTAAFMRQFMAAQ